MRQNKEELELLTRPRLTAGGFHVLRTYRRAARQVDECKIRVASFVQQFKRKMEANHSELDVARTIASIPC